MREDYVDHQEHAAVDAATAEEREGELGDDWWGRYGHGQLVEAIDPWSPGWSKWVPAVVRNAHEGAVLVLREGSTDTWGVFDRKHIRHREADQLTRDLSAVRTCLFTGQKSRTKVAAQEAFERICKLVEHGR